MICEVAGCDQRASARGLCKSHYQRWRRAENAKETCTVEGCTNPGFERRRDSGMLCQKHYNGARFKGRICSVPRCTKEAKGAGMCSMHYGRVRRAELAEQECSVEDCTKPAYQGYPGYEGKLCNTHYNRLYKHGTLEPLTPRKRYKKTDICKWEGCEEFARAHDLCPTHYQQARYNAKYEYLIPEDARAQRCVVPECENPQYAKALCRAHHAKQLGGYNVFEEVTPQKIDLSDFGKRLYVTRVNLGLTLKETGERVGLSRERIRQLESQAAPPLAKTIKKLADGLGVPPATLLGESIEHTPAGSVEKFDQSQKKKKKKKKEEEEEGVSQGGRQKRRNVSLEMECPWCNGTGELTVVLAGENNWTTRCAYCQGQRWVGIVPIPAPVPDEPRQEPRQEPRLEYEPGESLRETAERVKANSKASS